jgi:hypothetical protein
VSVITLDRGFNRKQRLATAPARIKKLANPLHPGLSGMDHVVEW